MLTNVEECLRWWHMLINVGQMLFTTSEMVSKIIFVVDVWQCWEYIAMQHSCDILINVVGQLYWCIRCRCLTMLWWNIESQHSSMLQQYLPKMSRDKHCADIASKCWTMLRHNFKWWYCPNEVTTYDTNVDDTYALYKHEKNYHPNFMFVCNIDQHLR